MLAEGVGFEERALVIDDPRLIGPGDGHGVRLRRRIDGGATTGRNDHRVGCERDDRVDIGVDTQAYVYATPPALAGSPVGKCRDLLASREHRHEPDLPPSWRTRSRSVTSCPRAAATQAASRPRPAAHDDDSFTRRRAPKRAASQLGLSPTLGFVTHVIG